MRPFSTLLLLAAVYFQALAAPASEHVNELQDRAVPAACASPLGVFLVYNILSALHAGPFCTQWLGITTKTVATTTTAVETLSTEISVTTDTVVPVTTTTTTTVLSTTIVSSTVTADTVTSTIPVATTVFSSVTAVTTQTSTITSTSTSYIINIQRKKEKRATRPPKLDQVKSVADNLISSACSCIATTPTVTSTAVASSALTITLTDTIVDTITSTAATLTGTQIDLFTVTSTINTTPLTTITSTATLTATTIVATQTTSTTRTAFNLQIIDVVIIPIDLPSCTVGTYYSKISNIGGTNYDAAAQACALRCVAAGKTNCDDFFTQQNLPSNTIDCFLLRKQDELNTNFFCNNPNIGRSSEWIIIY